MQCEGGMLLSCVRVLVRVLVRVRWRLNRPEKRAGFPFQRLFSAIVPMRRIASAAGMMHIYLYMLATGQLASWMQVFNQALAGGKWSTPQ
jgi:hypothetical protein